MIRRTEESCKPPSRPATRVTIAAAVLGVLGLAFLVAVLGAWHRTGAWFTDDAQVAVEIVSGEWPAPIPTPPGQAGTSIEVHKTATGFVTEYESGVVYGVRGEICVINVGEFPSEGLEIIDTVQYRSMGEKYNDYISQPVDTSVMPVLEAGREYCYSYEIYFDLPPGEGINYLNTVNVAILNHSGWLPGGEHCPGPDACLFGVGDTVDFSLPEGVPGPYKRLPPELATPTETPTPTVTNLPPTEPVDLDPTATMIPPTSPPDFDMTPTQVTPTDPPDNDPTYTETPLPTYTPDFNPTPTSTTLLTDS